MKGDLVEPFLCPLCLHVFRPKPMHKRNQGSLSARRIVRNVIRQHVDCHHLGLNAREKSLLADYVAARSEAS